MGMAVSRMHHTFTRPGRDNCTRDVVRLVGFRRGRVDQVFVSDPSLPQSSVHVHAADGVERERGGGGSGQYAVMQGGDTFFERSKGCDVNLGVGSR